MSSSLHIVLLCSTLFMGCARGGFTLHTDAADPTTADGSSPRPDLPPPPCPERLDTHTLLLFSFDSVVDHVVDKTGDHHGTIVGDGLSTTAGPPGCGEALTVAGGDASYVTVADAPAWRLDEGSVDLWVALDGPVSSLAGIVSRDANMQVKPGHLTVFQTCDDRLAARLQTSVKTSGYAVCSEPVTRGAWHRVVVNFGPGGLQMRVDGAEARSTKQSRCPGGLTLRCGQTATTEGISGNANPWVIGASSRRSAEGSATPVDYPFVGRIDALRISSARR